MLRHDFNNPITVDAFWMRQVQPGTRLLVSFLGTLLISAIDIPIPLLVLIACSFYLLLSRGVDWRWIVGHLTGLTTLAFFFALPLAWMGPGESSGPWGTRPDGVRLGIVVILKATAILTWSWATPLEAGCQANLSARAFGRSGLAYGQFHQPDSQGTAPDAFGPAPARGPHHRFPPRLPFAGQPVGNDAVEVFWAC